MSEVAQLIFNRSYTEELKERLLSGESLSDYFSIKIDVPGGTTLPSTLLVQDEKPVLDTGVDSDVENAILLFNFLEGLDKTQASDKRLWTYLSHVTFREYTIGRWGPKESARDLIVDPEERQKLITFISERWFIGGNARSLRRHSIARLWWAAYLTAAPWEKDPDYFASLETSDRFVYTRVLFITQDIVQQVLERKLGWSDKVLVGILEYLRQNPQIAEDRLAVRGLLKELNLILGYRKVSLLSFEEILDVISEASRGIDIG